MKSIKQLLSAILLGGALCVSGPVFADTAQSEAVTKSAQAGITAADKVNVNTATAEEIKQVLVGIGLKKAEAVVQYREKHGPFTAPEQLLEVQGFGKATLDKNKDRILL